MTLKDQVSKSILEGLRPKYPDAVLHPKDKWHPTEENPVLRFVLVTSAFDDKDTDSLETFVELRGAIEQAGVFDAYQGYLIIVMPMSHVEFMANGGTIFPDEESLAASQIELPTYD